MICIIGSGLSAMATAVALVRRGCRPVIIDAGITPERPTLELKERMAAVEPEAWTRDELLRLKRTGAAARSRIPRKLYFGSDFAYREAGWVGGLELRHAASCRSFAAGGFSNVWGATIQRLPDEEFQGWPITAGELSPHYSAVQALLCGPPDQQAEGIAASTPALRPSSQAQDLLTDLRAAREELARRGIRFDHARLAVRAADRNGSKGCRYCGLCVYGCPYESRYTATDTLTDLLKNKSAEYIPGTLVERVFHLEGGVRIEARSISDGTRRAFHARRVFLAAGVLGTARIIVDSLGLHGTPIRIRHSDMFTLPLVRYRAARNISGEKIHTFCQLVANIDDDAICVRPVHLQFYGYNDLYPELLARKTGWLGHPLAPALRALASRLFVIFGYLHSSVSSNLVLMLSADGDSRMRVEGRSSAKAVEISRAIARKLFQARKYFRALPVPGQLRMDIPGGGYHSGATFPMSAAPGPLETDRLGNLPPLPGVHLVDASVLPSVPACTIAFNVMANAHRIASECDITDVR